MENTNTNQDMKSVAKTGNKISVLHLARLQESDKKMESINQKVIDLHYKKLEVNQHEAALNNYSTEMLLERDSLLKELQEAYGTLHINSTTGEIQDIQNME